MGYFRAVNRKNIDINEEIEKYDATRILISDGIRITRGILKYSVKIQRILTPYKSLLYFFPLIVTDLIFPLAATGYISTLFTFTSSSYKFFSL